jgi:general stress protein YciG
MPRASFADWNKERLREVSSLGGKKAQQLGKGHRWTQETAQEAGRLGGTKVSQDTDHMSSIGKSGGRKGGLASAAKRRGASTAPSAEDPTGTTQQS